MGISDSNVGMDDEQEADVRNTKDQVVSTQTSTMSVEEIIEKSLGNLSLSQILQAIIAAIPPIFDNQQNLISVFADAQPAWHCTNTSNHTTCNSNSNICNLVNTDWVWNGNKNSSIISDWDLECSSSFIKGLPATSFFIGCLLSGFVLASLGDTSLGRKKLLFISLLTLSISAFACAFSPNIWFYCVFRFICGVGRVSITICSCVLLSERVGKRWRGQIVLLGFVSLATGLFSVTAIAYLTRNLSWRALYIYTSIPAFMYSSVVYFFLLESPRWLFMRGRQSDALAVLKRIGNVDPLISNSINRIKLEHCSSSIANPFVSINTLIKKRWAIQRLIVTMILSFGVGMMYYGMLLGVGSLGLNIYLNSVINAVLSLVSSLICYLFWIQRCNRRSSLLAFCTVSGFASITSSVIGQHHEAIHVGLELSALFCASMVFNILFMYVVELFPTCLRNTAASLSRQALILATVFVPVLVVIGRGNELISHTVFGIVITVCGVLVLTLPETRGKALCDTMEEQEARDKHFVFF